MSIASILNSTGGRIARGVVGDMIGGPELGGALAAGTIGRMSTEVDGKRVSLKPESVRNAVAQRKAQGGQGDG